MEDIKDKIQDVSLIRGLNTFLKGILTEEQHEKVKNRVKNYIADMGSDYKPDEEDVYAEATGRGMYRYLNESKGGAAFNQGGTTSQMQMAFMDEGGLKDEGGEVDPESGNDVPSGSLKKEVRDDMPTMLSEGEKIYLEAEVEQFLNQFIFNGGIRFDSDDLEEIEEKEKVVYNYLKEIIDNKLGLY